MIKLIGTRSVIALCLLSIGVAACNRAAEEIGATRDPGLLRYVPADTPYIFAMLEPVPDDLADKMETKVDLVLSAYRDLLRASLKSAAAESSASQAAKDMLEGSEAMVDGLSALLSVDGLRSAGIDRDSTMVLYGAGLLPVLRMTVSDGDLLEAAIARAEADANHGLSTATIGGQPYRFAGNDAMRLIFAIVGDEFVLSVVPTSLSEHMLKSVLGQTLPATSIAESGELQKIIDDNGFRRNSVGLIDIERIVATFIDDQSGVNAELLAMMAYDGSELDDTCRSEIRNLSAIVPRIVTGYTEMSVERFTSNTIVELRSDIAAGLATLSAPVPGLGSDQAGLFAFGMSIDLLAAREFYAARLDAMEADPLECDLFAGLQGGVAQGREVLQRPLPPIAYGIKGFLAVIEDLKGLNLASKQPPTSADFRFLLATDNAAGLLAMGAMFSPEIASLQIEPDGEPVRFESPQLDGMTDAAYVAMTQDALAISVGQGSAARLGEMLAAAVKEPHPFLSMEMDAARYYGFIADAVAMADDEDDDTPPEVHEAVARLMTVLAEMISRMTLQIVCTERGIEFPATIVLAE